ncbi:MAG: response regulator transcription factor [Chloroflexota bacterium]|nr:MAG: response regulator transcription factor [Chloroflexota bacterium]
MLPRSVFLMERYPFGPTFTGVARLGAMRYDEVYCLSKAHKGPLCTVELIQGRPYLNSAAQSRNGRTMEYSAVCGGGDHHVELIRVLLAHESAVVREGLLSMLRTVEDIEVVGQAHDNLQVLEKIVEHRPHVVLAGLHARYMDTLDAIRRIKHASPDTAVIVFATYEDGSTAAHFIRAGISAGASGYIPSTVSEDRLIHSIRTARKGGLLIESTLPWEDAPLGPPIRPSLSDDELADIQTAQQRMLPPLTPRQKEVLRLLVEGCTNKQIGEALSISKETAKKHVQSIIFRLGVSDRTQAAVKAIRDGRVS